MPPELDRMTFADWTYTVSLSPVQDNDFSRLMQQGCKALERSSRAYVSRYDGPVSFEEGLALLKDRCGPEAQAWMGAHSLSAQEINISIETKPGTGRQVVRVICAVCTCPTCPLRAVFPLLIVEDAR